MYIDDNDKVLNSFLDKRFFNNKNLNSSFQQIELIVRPECNQTCEYCYIYKHGKDLYPERIDNSKILNNIDKILNFIIIQKKTYVETYDLFAGDLFYDNLFFDILDIFYKYLFPLRYNTIIKVPCNLSFLKDEEKEKKFDEYYRKMESINVKIILSYSSDGLYAINSREKREISQEWFDKTLSFCAKYGYGTHPMVAYENIENFIQNYNWWIENLAKHNLNLNHWSPMLLPVRNDGWNDITINKFLQLLEYVFNYRLELFNGNIYNLAKHLTQNEKAPDIILGTPPSDLIKIYYRGHENDNDVNCTIGRALCINCQNLDIVPCHRLSYPHLAGGKFIEDEEKIIGIKASYNLSGYLNIINNNKNFRAGCSNCEIKNFCMQGCYGAQFESTGDPFSTIPSVCSLLKSKFYYLINKYNETGILNIILNKNFENYNGKMAEEIINYLDFMNIQLKKGENINE